MEHHPVLGPTGALEERVVRRPVQPIRRLEDGLGELGPGRRQQRVDTSAFGELQGPELVGRRVARVGRVDHVDRPAGGINTLRPLEDG